MLSRDLRVLLQAAPEFICHQMPLVPADETLHTGRICRADFGKIASELIYQTSNRMCERRISARGLAPRALLAKSGDIFDHQTEKGFPLASNG